MTSARRSVLTFAMLAMFLFFPVLVSHGTEAFPRTNLHSNSGNVLLAVSPIGHRTQMSGLTKALSPFISPDLSPESLSPVTGEETCHHPDSSPVPLWECHHEGSLFLSATSPLTHVVPSPIPFSLPSLPDVLPFPEATPLSSSVSGFPPDHPPRLHPV